MQKFEVLQGGKEHSPEKDKEGLEKELNQLVDTYACGGYTRSRSGMCGAEDMTEAGAFFIGYDLLKKRSLSLTESRALRHNLAVKQSRKKENITPIQKERQNTERKDVRILF